MSAPRVLWAALGGLLDHTVVLVGANVLWLAANLPLILIVLLALSPFGPLLAPAGDELARIAVPLLLAAWCVAWLPTPGALALASLARAASDGNSPKLHMFTASLRAHTRRALPLTAASAAGTLVILGNVLFYLLSAQGWWRLLIVPWAYALLFWMGLHVYLLPLAMHDEHASILNLYRRSAILTLGHLLSSALLAACSSVALLAGLAATPLYVLVGGAFAALIDAFAFRRLRLAHGDLVLDDAPELPA